MGYLISRLQEKNILKLDLESNNTALFIKEVLSSRKDTKLKGTNESLNLKLI